MCVCVCVCVCVCARVCVCVWHIMAHSILTVPQITALHPVRMVVPVFLASVIVLMSTMEATAKTVTMV